MYNILIKIKKGNKGLSLEPEYKGFRKQNLGELKPLSSVVYMGDGRLRTGSSVEKTLNGSFGYLYGFDENGCLLIYRDRLGTFPLFMFDDKKNNQLILFNRFYLIKEHWSDLNIDKIGFWETLLYESTLRAKSLFSNVLQVPCASYVKITPDLKHSVNRYWHINYENRRKLSKEKFLKESFERFDQVFAKLDKGKQYLLPISGGLDSRLMAAFMSRHLPKNNIHAITYGFDSRVLEYTYAKQVTSALGLRSPTFHTLTKDSYTKSLKSLAEITGGCISIQNCHLFDFVSQRFDNVDSICSSAYSDGIMGFDAKQHDDKRDSFDDCPFHNVLKVWSSKMAIPSSVSEAIKSELYKDFLEWREISTISSIEEYIYLIERNNKFHLLGSDIFRKYGDIILPFTEPDITEFYFTISNKFRYRKLGSINMLKTYFPSLSSIKTIGSLFGKEGLRRPYRFAHFRLINFANYLSASLLNDKTLFFNPYQTETHGYNLRKYHRGILKKAVDYLHANDILDGFLADTLNNIPARNASEFTLRYQIINGAYVLGHFKGVNLYATAEKG